MKRGGKIEVFKIESDKFREDLFYKFCVEDEWINKYIKEHMEDFIDIIFLEEQMLPLEEKIPLILSRVVKLLKGEYSCFMFYDEDAEKLKIMSSYGRRYDKELMREILPGERIVGFAFKHNTIICIEKSPYQLRKKFGVEPREDIEFGIVFPLFKDDRKFGVITVSSRKKHNSEYAIKSARILSYLIGRVLSRHYLIFENLSNFFHIISSSFRDLMFLVRDASGGTLYISPGMKKLSMEKEGNFNKWINGYANLKEGENIWWIDRKDGRYYYSILKRNIHVFGKNIEILLVRDIGNYVRYFEDMQFSQILQGFNIMLSGLLHHFSNPLSYAQASIEFMINLLNESEENFSSASPLLKDAAKEVEDGIKRLSYIVGEIRELLGANFQEKERIPLTLIIREVIRELKAENLVEQKNFEEEIFVFAYRNVKHVIFEILENALDAAGDKGRVEVKLEREGNYAVISVKNPGEKLNLSFKDMIVPFFSTKFGKGNLGLGLMRAYTIVKLNNGYIEGINQKEGGLVVKIKLPLSL